MDSYFGKTAVLKNTRNGNEVECEVDNIRSTPKGLNESLDAFVASNKIHMRWNGKIIRRQCARYGIYYQRPTTI